MATKKSGWQVVSLQPLTGALDARFRGTEAIDGAFKEKQNLAVSENGRLTRNCGFERLFADKRFWEGPYDIQGQAPCYPIVTFATHNGVTAYWCVSYTNWDFHRRNVATRKPITGLFEITKSDDTRRLYATTESEISLLDEDTGEWTDIFGGGGGKFKCDVLQDVIVFIDRKTGIWETTIGSGSVATITDLNNLGVSSAHVVIQFNGLMVLMNTVESDGNHTSRVRWSDLNKPLSWDPQAANSITGYQDLDYGERILAAVQMQNNILIFTDRALWNGFVTFDSTTQKALLSFQKIYTEPKNNAGCLVYPDSLVSTGDAVYYASRESYYTYNPYLPGPESPEWLRQATGLIYTDDTRKIDPTCCLSMCAEYRPLTHEIWISWPSVGNECLNNQSMVLSTKWLTGYYNDAGFTALSNYKPNPDAEADCNVSQILVGASSQDYSLKQVGLVLAREFVTQQPP